MTAPLTVLHITAHLGGGIGKALSGLILNTPTESGIRHEIACLEPPEKSQFIDKLTAAGCPIAISPDHDALVRLMGKADIVQLEWWGHPAVMATLCNATLPPMRLLIWSHVSVIHTPILPERLLKAAHAVIFTSPCSYEAHEVARLSPEEKERTGVIHSCGGFAGMDTPARATNAPLAAGYLGSLNFAKLHPRYVDFLTAVDIPGFTVRMIGDLLNRQVLEDQCRRAERPTLLEFAGYTTDVATELATINVFPYLLNPRHYGTSENALLEAMAMGVVPVVLDNPAERSLVTDRETGLVIRTREEFAAAISWLDRNPRERQRLSQRAVETVHGRFDVSRSVAAFSRWYASVGNAGKEVISFANLCGDTPSDWFLSSQRYPEFFTDNRQFGTIDEETLPGLFEKTKGSVFHYRNHFPDDERLAQWAQRLEAHAQRSHRILM